MYLLWLEKNVLVNLEAIESLVNNPDSSSTIRFVSGATQVISDSAAKKLVAFLQNKGFIQ